MMLIKPLDFRRITEVDSFPWVDSLGKHYYLPWNKLEPLMKIDKMRSRIAKIKKLNEKIKGNN